MTDETTSLVEFLESEVQPELFEKLDSAFPEFGWKRTTHGWIATDRAFTKERFDARPDRVVCNRPFGFLVHGRGPVTWTEFVHGTKPRGRAFVDAVRALAERCGVAVPVPFGPVRAKEGDDAAVVLEAVTAAAEAHLAASTAAAKEARDRLRRRGLATQDAQAAQLGLLPASDQLAADLADRLRIAEVSARAKLGGLGLLDPRWGGRIVGPWRDRDGSLRTLFGRGAPRATGPKYLNSMGRRPPLYGLPLQSATMNLIVVEGPFDALALRAAGFPNVLAAGGTTISPEGWSLLRELGCRDLTLWFDSDVAGQEGLLRAAEAASGGQNPGLAVHVVDPVALSRLQCERAHEGDPNGLLQSRGRGGVFEALAARVPARLFAALEEPGRFGPLEQVLVESGAGLEDLDHILKNGRDLPEAAREIAAKRDRERRKLEHALVWAHGLSRAGAGAARVGAYLRREFAALQESSPA